MGQTLDEMMIPSGEDFYYDDPFSVFVETHLKHLREHELTTVSVVEPDNAYLWKNDLHGYLLSMKISYQFHFLIMRLNRMTSPLDFTENTEKLLIPDMAYVGRLITLHRTSLAAV